MLVEVGVNVVVVVLVDLAAPAIHTTLVRHKRSSERQLNHKDQNHQSQNVDHGAAAVDGERTLRALPDLAHAAAPSHPHGRLQHADCPRPR